MSPYEFEEKMREIETNYCGDPEVIHATMDRIMCSLLEQLGYSEGVSIFLNTEKWYA